MKAPCPKGWGFCLLAALRGGERAGQYPKKSVARRDNSPPICQRAVGSLGGYTSKYRKNS